MSIIEELNSAENSVVAQGLEFPTTPISSHHSTQLSLIEELNATEASMAEEQDSAEEELESANDMWAQAISYGGNEYEYVGGYKNKKYNIETVETQTSIPITTYIKNEIKSIQTKIAVRTTLITMNLTPRYEFSYAWKFYLKQRKVILDALLNEFPEIKFMIGSIEHHHTVPSRYREKNKKKASDDTKEKPKTKEEKQAADITDYLQPNEKDTVQEQKHKKALIKERDKKKKEDVSLQDINGLDPNSLLTVYGQKSKDAFDEKVSKWKVDMGVLAGMDNEDKVMTYHNLMQVLQFLNTSVAREKEFKEWIVEEKKKMRGCMSDGVGSIGNYYQFTEKELAMITTHKKMGLVMVGMPHLHISVCYQSQLDDNKFKLKLETFLRNQNKFPDIDIREARTKEAEKGGYNIGYVLKNHSSGFVKKRLEEFGDEQQIVIAVINCDRDREKYEYFLKGFIEKRHGRAHFQLIPMDIYARRGECLLSPTMEAQTDPDKSMYHRMIACIETTMEERNYRLCENKIFALEPGTKNTYSVKYNAIREFIWAVCNRGEMRGHISKHENELVKTILHAGMTISESGPKELEEADISKIPTMIMDYMMVEYKDVTVHSLTYGIYTKQMLLPCHKYINKNYIDDLSYNNEKFEALNQWYANLKRNHINTMEFFALYYQSTIPGPLKTPSLALVGLPGCGKSAVCIPAESFFPEHKTVPMEGEYSSEKIGAVVSKNEFMRMEESNGALNAVHTRGSLLKILEGQRTGITVKYESSTAVDVKTKFMFTLNQLPEDTYWKDKAVMERIVFHNLYPIDGDKRRSMETILKQQWPDIIAYACQQHQLLGVGYVNRKVEEEFTIEHMKHANVYREVCGHKSIGDVYNKNDPDEYEKWIKVLEEATARNDKLSSAYHNYRVKQNEAFVLSMEQWIENEKCEANDRLGGNPRFKLISI